MSGRRKEKRRFRRTAGPGRPCRCLDAAHGKGIGPIASGQRIHKGAVEPQQAPAMTVRDHGRRGPRIAIRADIAQVSRSAGAVARSRPGIREQSLEWMPRRGNKFNSEFTMQNCEIICHSEEQSDEESINQQYLFFVCSPGPAAGVASLMRAGPGRKVFRIRKRKSLP